MRKSLLFIAIIAMILPLVSSADNEVSLTKYHVQLGDSLVVDADNLKVDGQIFNGNAMIVFNNGDDEYTLLTQVVDGEFSHKIEFCKSGCFLPGIPGNYSVSVKLLDSRLAELSELVLDNKLVVDSRLNVLADLKEAQIMPGDKIKIEGSVQRNSDGGLLNYGDIKIIFDGSEYNTAISNEKFEYEIETGSDISSNYHEIQIIASDDQGNYGEKTLQFFVIPIPQSLSISTDKEEYLPGENVQIKVSLLDQAGDDISDDVELKIYNAKNKRLVKDYILVNEGYELDLPEYAVPGEWKIIARSNDLKADELFSVAEVKKLDVVLLGQYLFVKNVGNVYYSDPLIMYVDGEDKIEKRTNLNPGENMSIILYKDVKEGKHNVSIDNMNESFEVDVIDNRNFGQKLEDFFSSVTGQAVRSSGSGTSDLPFLILVGFIIGGLIFTSVKFRKKGGKINLKFKKPSFSKMKSTAIEDIDEIRKRILKDIESSGIGNKDSKSFSVDPVVESGEKPKEVKKVEFDEPLRKEDNSFKRSQNNDSNLFKLFD